MKKTILLFALGLGTICLSSCSRGYGCPYTMDTTIQTENTNLAEKAVRQNTEAGNEKLIYDQIEIPATETIAE